MTYFTFIKWQCIPSDTSRRRNVTSLLKFSIGKGPKNINLDTMYAKGIFDERRGAPRMDAIIDEGAFKKLEDLGELK